MKIALVRGPYLRPNGVLPWEYLNSHYKDVEVTAFSSTPERFDTSCLKMPVKHLYWLDGLFYPIKGLGLLHFPQNILLGMRKAIEGFDLVHTSENFHFFSFQLALLTARAKIRFAFVQGENIPYPIFQHNLVTWKIKRYVNRRACLITATTELAKRALIHEGVNPYKIFIVPNAVDVKRFEPKEKTLPKTFNLPDELEKTFNILFIGELNIQKGVPWLLRAFKRLIRIHKDIRLILIGKNHLNGILKELLEASNRIYHFEHVPQKEINEFYHICDVHILPSVPTVNNEEQFGMVVLEAMACGRPTIVTNTGGLPWIVEKDKTSLVIPPRSTRAIEKAILNLYRNSEKKVEMGKYSRQYVVAKYSPKVIAEKLYRVYVSTGIRARSELQKG